MCRNLYQTPQIQTNMKQEEQTIFSNSNIKFVTLQFALSFRMENTHSLAIFSFSSFWNSSKLLYKYRMQVSIWQLECIKVDVEIE